MSNVCPHIRYLGHMRGYLYWVTARAERRPHRQLCEAVGVMDDFGFLRFVGVA